MELDTTDNARSRDAAAYLACVALPSQAALLMRVLDEIDYGIVLLDADGRLRYANQLGLNELAAAGPLFLAEGCVRARHGTDQAVLRQGLADAGQGRRRLFAVGTGQACASIAAVPVPAGEEDADTLVLLVFGKRHASQTLTMDFYARSHGLTSAEMAVLRSICSGMKPKEIAREQCVAISTVRSHICSIRAKTQTGCIRDLINRVAVLPPITPVMKAMASARVATAVH